MTLLSEAERSHFDTFGFVVLRQRLTPAEVSTMRSEMRSAMEHAYRANPFDGSRRHWLPMMGEDTPFFASLLEDPRFFDVAEQLFGGEALGWLVDANRYVGNTPWHNDAFASTRGIKFAIYLDPVDGDSGALRVIPGSHRQPLHGEVVEYMKTQPAIEDLPAVPCTTEPGDVVAFEFPIWHASVGGSNDRSMCTVDYFELPGDPQKTAEVVEGLTGLLASATDRDWGDRDGHPLIGDPGWIAGAQGNPRRQVLLDRMRACGLIPDAEEVPA